MGFLSTLGKIGKIAAPIALSLTGVGIPAAAALMAAEGIIEKKARGGSWGDALKSGALQGGTTALGGAFGGVGGGAGAAAGSTGGKVAGTSFLSGLKTAGLNLLKDPKQVASIVGDVSSVLGKQQGTKEAGKVTQAGVTQAQDRNTLQRFEAMQRAQQDAARLDLDRKKYTGDEQQRNARNALMSSLLKGGLAPTRVNVPGIASANISGGLMESLKNNPDALKVLGTLQGQSTEGLSMPPAFTGGEMLKGPEMTPLPDVGGKGDTFLNTIANIGEMVGAAGKFKPPTMAATAPAAAAPAGMPPVPNALPEEDEPFAQRDPRVYKNIF